MQGCVVDAPHRHRPRHLRLVVSEAGGTSLMRPARMSDSCFVSVGVCSSVGGNAWAEARGGDVC